MNPYVVHKSSLRFCTLIPPHTEFNKQAMDHFKCKSMIHISSLNPKALTTWIHDPIWNYSTETVFVHMLHKEIYFFCATATTTKLRKRSSCRETAYPLNTNTSLTHHFVRDGESILLDLLKDWPTRVILLFVGKPQVPEVLQNPVNTKFQSLPRHLLALSNRQHQASVSSHTFAFLYHSTPSFSQCPDTCLLYESTPTFSK